MAKTISVSVDNGVSYRVLPGSSGEYRAELGSFDDTVFGQDWKSEDVSLGMWMVTANSRFKGFAGYTATLKQGGTPTAMTGEACTLVSGKTYQITASARRVINYSAALSVFDGVTDVTAQVQSVDYLNGLVIFKSSYTIVGAITVTGQFIPMVTLASGKTFSLTQTAVERDESTYEQAQGNGGWKTMRAGLRTVNLEVGGIFNAANGAGAALASRAITYIEIAPPGALTTFFRGFFKRMEAGQSGDVGNVEDSNLKFTLYVPDGQLLVTPFSWYYGNNSPLNPAVRSVLETWQGGGILKVRYSPTGTGGTQGDAIVTECSISNDIDGQNEFKFTFRGTDAPADY